MDPSKHRANTDETLSNGLTSYILVNGGAQCNLIFTYARVEGSDRYTRAHGTYVVNEPSTCRIRRYTNMTSEHTCSAVAKASHLWICRLPDHLQ